MARPILSFRNEVRQASILQWNARGLRSRISSFRPYVFTNRIPVIVICEPNIEKPLKLSGYEAFVSSTCVERSKVVVYIRTDFTYVHHAVQPHDDNQYVCLRVRKEKVSFTLIGVYISPAGRFEQDRLRDILSATSGPWVITGDFNAHHLLWGSSTINAKGRNLVSFASKHDLCFINDGSPTYLRGLTYSSCLDLTLVSRSFRSQVQWFSDIETHGSDHIPTYVRIRGLTNSSSRNKIRRIDWQKFQRLMENACREDFGHNLEDVIKEAMREASCMLPFAGKRSDFDVELEKLCTLRRRAERRYRRTKAICDLRLARCLQKKKSNLNSSTGNHFVSHWILASHCHASGALFVACARLPNKDILSWL